MTRTYTYCITSSLIYDNILDTVTAALEHGFQETIGSRKVTIIDPCTKECIFTIQLEESQAHPRDPNNNSPVETEPTIYRISYRPQPAHADDKEAKNKQEAELKALTDSAKRHTTYAQKILVSDDRELTHV